MIAGIDISEQNGQIEWEKLDGRDIGYVYIKASESTEKVDAMFNDNFQAAKRLGLLIGAYHWLNPALHVGQQAALFIETVGDLNDMLVPAVVLENYHASGGENEKFIRIFLDLIESRFGMRPVIYTSETYWNTYLPEAGWGCDYPLWIDKPGVIWPSQVWPWAGWAFWQNSYEAAIPGIPVNLGLNWFNGSKEELYNMVVQ